MAHVDFFLKIDGIEGESKDHKHKGEIEVLSWGFVSQQQGSVAAGGGGGAGKVDVHDMNFTMHLSKASPKLALACASGDHIKQAVLTCRKAGGQQQEFAKYTLSDVLVAAYQTGGSGHGSVVPLEQMSLHFDKIEMEYREQKKDGTLGSPVKTGWNVRQNKAV